jgi:hypothetical protein
LIGCGIGCESRSPLPEGDPFTVKNIQEEPEALAELQKLGYRATPVTVIDGDVVVGFDRGRIERLLLTPGLE